MRCDKQLFAWISSIANGGARTRLPFNTLLEQARLAFPATGRPGETNVSLTHLTRKRVIHYAQKLALRGGQTEPIHCAGRGAAPVYLARRAAHRVPPEFEERSV